jgi:hypothetical protein
MGEACPGGATSEAMLSRKVRAACRPICGHTYLHRHISHRMLAGSVPDGWIEFEPQIASDTRVRVVGTTARVGAAMVR